MSAHTFRTPTYRLHKPSGQAVVTVDGRDFYLGKLGSPESRDEFDRLIASGNPAEAREHLRWVRENGVKSVVALDLARETLRRLDDSPPAPMRP